MKEFEQFFEQKIASVLGTQDPAHDLLHVKRVVATAKKLAQEEKADLDVVVPAAWLHDLVNLAKDHPQRKLASTMAANEAVIFLKSIHYYEDKLEAIRHAIEAHSFSAGISPETLESKIIQDADRLDALGAIGLARLFSITTQLKRPFYHFTEPIALNRKLDDHDNAIDHIFIKLKKISETMNTPSAKEEARRRFRFIENYLEQLKTEI